MFKLCKTIRKNSHKGTKTRCTKKQGDKGTRGQGNKGTKSLCHFVTLYNLMNLNVLEPSWLGIPFSQCIFYTNLNDNQKKAKYSISAVKFITKNTTKTKTFYL